jgi:hypothetical protein
MVPNGKHILAHVSCVVKRLRVYNARVESEIDEFDSYAEAIRDRLESAHNMWGKPASIRMLAAAVGMSYEHIRKILAGKPVASEELNRRLARALRFDPVDLWELARREKAARRFGTGIFSDGLPSSRRLRNVWRRLSPDDQATVLRIAEGLAAKPPVGKKTGR